MRYGSGENLLTISTTLAATPSQRSQLGPMPLGIGVLFFIFGFVTWLNGPLTIFVKLAFDLDDVSAFLVPVAFYLSYFCLALPSSVVLRRTGMKRGMALGLFVMAIGAVLFGEFINIRIYHGALVGLFVIGAGLSLLQTASNPYISILGPIDSAAQRIAFMALQVVARCARRRLRQQRRDRRRRARRGAFGRHQRAVSNSPSPATRTARSPSNAWPALTTARQATEEIARHAAQRLIGDLQRAANGEPAQNRNEGFSPEPGGARFDCAAARHLAALKTGSPASTYGPA
ncbi:hypothetical protein RLIN73S_04207 [Rhodanobacter lindaniclasticus]